MEILYVFLNGFHENLNFPEIMLPDSPLPQFILEKNMREFQIIGKGLPGKVISQGRGNIHLLSLELVKATEIEGL